MRRSFFIVIFLFLVFTNSAYSAGTPAGTVITNSVKLVFNYGDQKGLEAIAQTSITVDNKVNVIVTNLGNTNVIPGEKEKPLIFTLTNAGNSSQRYRLEVGPVYAPNNVELTNIKIFWDKDNSGTVTPEDILYVDPESFGNILPDQTIKILVIADIPDNLENGQFSQYYLMATTVDADTKNDTLPSQGSNTSGVDIVFADTDGVVDINKDGKHSALGLFLVKTAIVKIEKSMEVISDPYGENKPYKNSIIRYSLIVTVEGEAKAEKVVIIDKIPEGTWYVANSIKLNGNPLTDSNDGDNGYISDNTIYVKLGDLTQKTPKQIITFDVKIK